MTGYCLTCLHRICTLQYGVTIYGVVLSIHHVEMSSKNLYLYGSVCTLPESGRDTKCTKTARVTTQGTSSFPDISNTVGRNIQQKIKLVTYHLFNCL